MRRKIKKEIKGIIQTMSEAHEHVLFLLENKRIAEANDLLLQCQECAAHIGESIEKSEGMDTKAVSYLETYCEHLYTMSRMIDRKKLFGIKRQLDGCLRQTEYEIDEVIPLDKLKIAFMPYKASMWDCMESVWEAADADEECDAYVVPIPYYERNEQGGAEKFCYEGDIFPTDVPITSYEDFSLDKERPDIIYIHNPYDGNNYVTSVHPDYYTENLKKYTDELVYIPYYILGEGGMPDSHRSLPSYQYIDKIIVQDEDKKESMLDFVPEEKIVAIGCPKVDRLLKLDKKKQEILEHEIPQEWREKIAGKKVILFNISITGILNNKRYAMKKIRYVLSCFENRDDVVLLWRPHPLVEATLKSMRPELYGEYMEIKDSFVRKGEGILDETGDAGIAAVVADAYLGENSSSLVHYFGVLGKPVMYIDWGGTEDKNKSRDYLDFSTYYQMEDYIFFVPRNAGLAHQLYKFNIENGKTEKVITFPGTVSNVTGCYYGIKKLQNKIILVPHNTEDIYVYDINKKQGIKVVLSEPLNNVGMFGRFDEAVEYDGKLFLIPRCYPGIISIDVHSLEIHEYKECIKPFLLTDRTKQMFQWAYIKKDQYLYVASCNDSRILIFNMEDESYEIKKIGDFSFGYYRLIYDGEYFWLGAYGANLIVRWNENSGEVKEYTYPIEQEPLYDWCYYSSLIDNNDEIIVCYAFCIDIVFINKKTGTCRKPTQIRNILDKIRRESTGIEIGFAYANVLENNKVLLFNSKNCSINIWDIQKNQWKTFYCRLPLDEMLSIERKNIENCYLSKGIPYYLSENVISIAQFIDYVTTWGSDIFKCEYECYYEPESNSTIGALIHVYVKEK